jgi:hypothetical protein
MAVMFSVLFFLLAIFIIHELRWKRALQKMTCPAPPAHARLIPKLMQRSGPLMTMMTLHVVLEIRRMQMIQNNADAI